MPELADTGATGSFVRRRAIAVTVALGLLVPTSAAWANNVASPTTAILALLLTGSALVTTGLLACATEERQVAKLEAVLLGAGLIALIVETATFLPGPPSYLTADSGLAHAAALSLKAGHDPYSAHLGWAVKAFGFAPTYTTSGGVSTLLAHPSLPLLATFVLLSVRSDVPAATIVEIISLAVTMMVLYRALPEPLRLLAVLVGVVLPALPNQVVAGAGETLLLPTLILVAYRWRDIGHGGTLGWTGKLNAIALGLAASTNQLSWLMAPFLLVGIALARGPELGARQTLRVLVRYAAIASAVFLVLNGPFIAWDPGSWFHGVFSWFGGSAVPSNQGLAAALMLHAHVGGGDLPAFNWAEALGYVGLLAVYALRFDRLQSLWCVLPCLSLWLGERATISDLIIAGVVVLVTVLQAGTPPASDASRGVEAAQRRRRRLRLRLRLRVLAPMLALAPAASALGLALASPAPLLLRLVSANLPRSASEVPTLTIAVANRSHAGLVPHFQISDAESTSGFWDLRTGPRTLPADASATYVIAAPRSGPRPEAGTPFAIDAVTGKPQTLSSAAVTVPAGR